MEIFLAIAAVAGLIWGLVLVLRGSLVAGGVVYAISACCFGNDFLTFNVGVTWSIERLMFLLLLVAYFVQWRTSRVGWRPLDRAEWLLVAFVGLLLVSTFTHDYRDSGAHKDGVVQHLINGYLIPVAIFFVARSATRTEHDTRVTYALLSLFGVYLAVTAVAEVQQQWWAVFPGYISDPKLGIHYGRARGPMLQSATLGMYLAVCYVATWGWLCRGKPYGWCGVAITVLLLPLYAAATWFTYTRICWIGLGISVCVVLAGTLRGTMRSLVLGAVLLAATGAVAAKWSEFVAFPRENASSELTRESTYMRASFAYVSWKMFLDHPIWGVGFGQFPRENRPYLTDENVDLRLEAIRGYVHHNTFLGVLVDMGLIGFTVFTALMLQWLYSGWRLWRESRAPDYMRAHGLIFLAAMIPYLLQMMFHDVSYTPVENALVYLLAGVVSGMRHELAVTRAPQREPIAVAMPVLAPLPHA